MTRAFVVVVVSLFVVVPLVVVVPFVVVVSLVVVVPLAVVFAFLLRFERHEDVVLFAFMDDRALWDRDCGLLLSQDELDRPEHARPQREGLLPTFDRLIGKLDPHLAGAAGCVDAVVNERDLAAEGHPSERLQADEGGLSPSNAREVPLVDRRDHPYAAEVLDQEELARRVNVFIRGDIPRRYDARPGGAEGVATVAVLFVCFELLQVLGGQAEDPQPLLRRVELDLLLPDLPPQLKDPAVPVQPRLGQRLLSLVEGAHGRDRLLL